MWRSNIIYYNSENTKLDQAAVLREPPEFIDLPSTSSKSQDHDGKISPASVTPSLKIRKRRTCLTGSQTSISNHVHFNVLEVMVWSNSRLYPSRTEVVTSGNQWLGFKGRPIDASMVTFVALWRERYLTSLSSVQACVVGVGNHKRSGLTKSRQC